MGLLRETEKIGAFFLYIALICVIYGPVVFTGKTLQPPMYQPHGVVEGWPEGYKGRVPENRFNVDLATPAYFEWPVNRLVGNIYKNGEVPLWNPYQAGGTPLAAQYSTRAFFPYQVAEDISPVEYWDFFILGRLLIAGFFTFLFLRLLGVGFTGALLGGAFYIFSGSFTWFINLEQYANSAMMLPVLVYATERLFKFGRGREAAVAGISIALVLLAGQPEMALCALLLGAAYFVLRSLTNLRSSSIIRNARNFIVAAVLGLMISSPLIVPFAELMTNSHSTHLPGGGGGDGGAQVIQGVPVTASFLTPTAHELPQDPSFSPSAPLALEKTPEGEKFYFRYFPINGVWDLLGGYSGVVCLYIMMAGLFTAVLRRDAALRGLRAPLFFFAAFGAVVVLKNFGVIPLEWLWRLPFFDEAWSQRWWGPAWTFSFAAAAGIGYHAIKTAFSNKGMEEAGGASPAGELPVGSAAAGATGAGGAGRLLPFIIALGALLGIYAYLLPVQAIAAFIKSANYGPFFMNLAPSLMLGSALTPVILGAAFVITLLYARKGLSLSSLLPLGVLELWWAVPRGYGYEWLLLKAIPLVIGGYTITLFLRRHRTMAVAGSLLFLLSFMLLDMNSPRGMPERYDPFTEAPYVEFLKKNAGFGRVAAGYGILFPNFASAVGLHDIRYINSLTIDSFQDFRNTRLHALPPAGGESASLWFTGMPEGFIMGENNVKLANRGMEKDFVGRLDSYSLLGVKYLILPRDVDINAAALARSRGDGQEPKEFPLVYDREVRIYENTGALPRAYMAFDVGITSGYMEAQALLDNPEFEPGRTVVIEKDPPGWFSPGEAGTGEARITGYRTNHVLVDAVTSAQGVLVLNDVYYPGWKAYVDGKKAGVYRANGIVRGVFLDKGRHTVEFVYMPLSFLIGCGIALAGLASCCFLSAIDILRRSRRWGGVST